MDTKHSFILISNQLNDLLSQLSDGQYALKIPLLSGATIGAHTRHILDFYTVLLQNEAKVIDYEIRSRDPVLELSVCEALKKIKALKAVLASLDTEAEIRVKTDFTCSGGNCVYVKSTVGRELMYAFDHAIHHMAIIKMAVLELFPKIQLHDEFGIALSTLKYRKLCAQ